jgi:phosphoglucosamine mutase
MTEKKYFGTDGIRGKANQFPMDAATTTRIGICAGAILKNKNKKIKVIIGRDTRESGPMIESALTSGLNSVGIDVLLVGVMPTPSMEILLKSLKSDFGIIISASHNPYYDNGIKFFNKDGHKLSDNTENQIEKLLDEKDLSKYLVEQDNIGIKQYLDNNLCQRNYIDYIKNLFPKYFSLKGIKIVLDCANGASYKIAPTLLTEFNANLITISDNPDGFNINEKCGSTHIELLQETVVENQADLGIALDGDADRLILVDEKGQKIDGDKIIALMAKKLQEEGVLKKKTVVVTKMSNLGLENYLKQLGLKVIRTKVGAKYVVTTMQEGGYNIGGEESGHIILSDYFTTGDGIYTALQVLTILCKEKNKKISELANLYKTVPQILKNINFENKSDPLKDKTFLKILKKYKKKFGNKGRILIRKSGTQPLIRVMVECVNENLTNTIADELTNEIHKILQYL